MLARMMQMLMNEDFVEKLRAAKTPAEFLDAIDAQEDAQFGERELHPTGDPPERLPCAGRHGLRQRHCPHLHGR